MPAVCPTHSIILYSYNMQASGIFQGSNIYAEENIFTENGTSTWRLQEVARFRALFSSPNIIRVIKPSR
jgi:hypothetical protein